MAQGLRVKAHVLVRCDNMRRYYKSGGKICAKGKAWAKRTFDTYPSAYANMAASKYCKDPNYAKGAKGKKAKK